MKLNNILSVEPLGFQWKTKDPFLFCAHHHDHFPNGNGNFGPDPSLLRGRNIGSDFSGKDGWSMYHGQKVPGFPVHPHRGFETVTVVRKGFIDHTDSMKAAGRYGNGDVQWMTAGLGVQHAEMFPMMKEGEDNPLELFQIWLNLPAKSKMVTPYFKMFWADSIPKLNHKDETGKTTSVEIIAGKLENIDAPTPPPDSWASIASNDVAIWNLKMEAGAKFSLPAASAASNRVLYFYEGDQLQVSGQEISNYHMVEVISDAKIELKATSETSILVLQGKPINEPVVQYGPFVMNTKEQIQETYLEYQQTQFGGWPWSSSEPNHGDKGRFAQYADGTIDQP